MNGIFYGVGVGPGDPELMTLQAVRILKECDIIVVPGKDRTKCLAYQIASQAVTELEDKTIIEAEFPMTKDLGVLEEKYEKVMTMILPYLKAGENVAMLTIGDPSIYSTYIYVQNRVKAYDIETKLICGITSFCAASAALNMSLVEREEPLHIYPASYDIKEAMAMSGTKIFMKSASKFGSVIKQLEDSSCEISMVENCGLENERRIKGIEHFPEESSYYTIIIAKECNDTLQNSGGSL